MHRIDSMNRERATAILMDFCHTKVRFQEKNILGTSLENLRWVRKPIFVALAQA